MGNYVIEDEVTDYDVSYSEPKEHKPKWLIIGVAIFVIVVFFIILFSKTGGGNSYTSLEKEMVTNAENYINNNYTGSSKEVYVDTSKLNMNIPSNCNLLSGVLYKDGDYIPYLLCDDYKSDSKDINDSTGLVGDNIILLTRGSNYYELGYNGSGDVQISGRVNTNEEGVYNIYYISSINGYSIRKVIVVDNIEVNNLAPVIDTKNEEVVLNIGEEYNDNTIVIDKIDGNITNKMIKVSDVDLKETGEYSNIYSATNSLGYTTMAEKKIIVLNNEETNIYAELSNENMVNDNLEIIIRIFGENYNHLILPNGDEITEKEMIYEVEENGEYKFVAVNNDGSEVSKIIKVSNIDKTSPVGTCTAISYYNKTVFTVNISSFNYVVGYNYIADGSESGYITSSSYNLGIGNTENLLVKVKDYIGNESTINCTVTEKKSSVDPNGYTKLTNHSSRLRIPISDALAKRGYKVSDLNMCIYKRVQEAGPYTRYGVVAAAYGLIECTYNMTGYVLSYNHESGKVEDKYCQYNSDICGKLGINTRWGYKGGACNKNAVECWHGLNCATFVRWSMCNGGMDLCSKGTAGAYSMTSKTYFPEADGVVIRGSRVTYYSGRDLTKYSAEQLLHMIKPGDIIAQQALNDSDGSTQHTYVIIGVDNNAIYTANDGYFYKTYTFKQMLKGDMDYRILYLDNYYANPNNRNNLYN